MAPLGEGLGPQNSEESIICLFTMICNSDDRKSINSSGLELSPFFFSILKHVCEFEISDTNRFDFFV